MKKKSASPLPRVTAPRIAPLRPEETVRGAAIGWQRTGDRKGRGVFARRALRKGEIIEICPVIPVGKGAVRETGEAPDGYLLMWREDVKGQEYCMPLGYAMLYNHSSAPNIEMSSNYRTREITVKTLRPIKKGEELVWDYACDIWF